MTQKVIVALLLALPLLAQKPPPRQPWEWTDEERVAARYARAPGDHRATAYGQDARVVTYDISGKERPELFMRYELFDSLVKGVDSDPLLRSRRREKLDPMLRRLGFDDPGVFWNDLYAITRPYFDARREEGRHPSDRYGSIDAVVCNARFEALANSRRHFGPQRFDALLYTVIAPALDRSEATSYPDPGDMIRYQARGCR